MTLYSKASGRFYDEWEALPEKEREREISKRLDEYIGYARQLPFYEQRLTGYNPHSTSPLQEVPSLTATDLRPALPPQGTGLVLDRSNGFTVFQSGGTTGVPKSTLFSHQELEGLNLPNARGFFATGLTPSDKVGNLWAVGSLYMTFVHINRMVQQYGCENYPFSNHTITEFIHTVVTKFGLNCLTGIASSTLNVVRAMVQMSDKPISIPKIYYGGEHFYEADKEELRNKVGAEIIMAPGYGTVDTWYLGYQCSLCPTSVFHTHDDQVYLEIVDPATNAACAPEQVGMLYATPYLRRVTPIVRYQVGDRAKWLGENCPCGRTTPVFKLLGRGDDVLRIGYDSVDYNAVQDVVGAIQGLSGSIQMEKSRIDGKDKLIIRVETEAPKEQRPRLAEQLEKQMLATRPSLSEFIQLGTVWPLEISLVDLESLPRNPKTGKLIRVKDVIGDDA